MRSKMRSKFLQVRSKIPRCVPKGARSQKFFILMEKKFVDVVYDRRKEVATKGVGTLDIRVYIGRNSRKYHNLGKYAPTEWEAAAHSPEVQAIIKKSEQVLSVMEFLKEEMTVDNFNKHYYEEEEQNQPELSLAEQSANKDFIAYCEEALAAEDIKIGTRKHKQVVIDAVKTYGKLRTYGDLTPKNILAFDRWLHNGERSDVTIYGYHKRLKKWVGELARLEEIPRNPYKIVSITRGKCKERQPLLESELKKMRDADFDGNAKLERVRDLFIFSAYTGLAFCDTQAFDYKSMTVQEGNMTFIDGSRIKTDTQYFTPILAPAMEVLKKYDFKLPRISNQKANDYLHLIQAQLGIKKPLTFHVARHSFATLALAHDVPIENVARMLGHEDIRTTQIYAKVLHTTIERHASNLQSAII